MDPEPVPVDVDVGVAADEALGTALARIGAAQFSRIVAALATGPDRDLAVHEARKALKRLRALLRLAREHLDAAAAGDLDRQLRDLGRRLAPLRDAAASIETLDAAAPGRCPAFRADLVAGHAAAMPAGAAGAPLPSSVAAGAEKAAQWWSDHLPGIPDGFDAVSDGLGRTYKRGRAAMRRALEGRGAADFHEWRKEVKALRYQMESLLPGGGPLRPQDLFELGETLGVEHDLAVLRELTRTGDRSECAALLPVLDARSDELRCRAAALGEAVFATGRRRFVEAVRGAWGSARPASPGLDGLRR